MQKQTKKVKPVVKSVAKKLVAVSAVNIEAVKPRANAQLQGPHKTFQQDGHWIEKPNKTQIFICLCGNRYLKTRPKQEKCLRCVSAAFTYKPR
ncbi:hypothetical protein A2419_00760 [Candidatus Adlerbacteria bacterium RIFOXYC1_FULL_48_26]|uniref:Uncharacterized protein n=1 Tax=Candidatus Adlerbacteria bacterium RIFOXYC1_FULL_48_26 TaxID=1797247 RepID=A0A1F4Y318_9BACT|nr:MAG: hypothetical protein A2419_00760 [Candidatus Adlerbacteria bacterium RIFOXYC1_FULL_48_26]OGC94460.1 MAG: hypothetical protein A2389_01065 [Candidatus Adlerbacteria bacterium RIFOXYB1_FULL_48_10]